MSLFKKSVNDQAYLKMGILGFAGTGKTRTASNMAIGLHKMLVDRNLSPKPIYFLDTETGSDWVNPYFKKAGIELFVAKTRAFTDLLTATKEAQKEASILIVDSISHFWKEIVDTFLRKKSERIGKKIHRMEFQDWATVKAEWAQFTDAYVNSQLHIIMCGRAGYEYDYFENDDGKKELEKTGIKMKAETELGFEPSLLVLMERDMDMDTKTVYRTAKIMKDRSDTIDGKEFKNPTFESFLPHVMSLNLGGVHVGVDITRTSDDLIGVDGKTDYEREMKEKAIVLDEIESALISIYPGQTKEEKKAKLDLLDKHFYSKSWERIKTMALVDLKKGYQALNDELFPPAGDLPTVLQEKENDPETPPPIPDPAPDTERTVSQTQHDDLFALMQASTEGLDPKAKDVQVKFILNHFGVKTMKDLPVSRFEEVRDYLDAAVKKG